MIVAYCDVCRRPHDLAAPCMTDERDPVRECREAIHAIDEIAAALHRLAEVCKKA